VGRRFGVTRERIRQIEAKAFAQTSGTPAESKARDFLEMSAVCVGADVIPAVRCDSMKEFPMSTTRFSVIWLRVRVGGAIMRVDIYLKLAAVKRRTVAQE
jgi:hypothetical protein